MADNVGSVHAGVPADWASAIESALERHLPAASDLSPRLIEALRYASLGGGKRLRPSIVCATCTALGGSLDHALDPAVAVEYIHTYSLVHDDLPAMDDDDLRRGRPACHIAFDEATALLVGDGLQALAFDVLANAPTLAAGTRLRMIQLLADAVGWRGMVGGQALDMDATGREALTLDEMRRMHAAKTGRLFRASVQLGALSADPRIDDARFEQLTVLGEKLGLAFQIVDDVLDVTQPSERLGKTAGSDVANAKNSYPALVGIEPARSLALDTLQEALDLLGALGLGDGPLEALARSTVHRVR